MAEAFRKVENGEHFWYDLIECQVFPIFGRILYDKREFSEKQSLDRGDLRWRDDPLRGDCLTDADQSYQIVVVEVKR